MLSQDAPLIQAADPNLAVLGFLAVFFAGAFFLSSVGRDRPRQRVGAVLGAKSTSLAPLRAALQSKARAQAAAFFLMVGAATLIAAFFFRLEVGRSFVYWAAGAMTIFSLVFLGLLEGYVAGAMRRYLAAHLRQHPFDFEDHLALTREIGELFRVRSHGEDTLESYVSKLRAALGVPAPPERGGLRIPRMLD